MNSIQLELFPQEIIQVGANQRAYILCLKFGKQEAWTSFWEISPLIYILEVAGRRAGRFDVLQMPDCTESWSHEFLCPVGTWNKLSTSTSFRRTAGVDLLALSSLRGILDVV